MTTMKLMLRLPSDLTDQAVTDSLIKELDLTVNILQGRIIPKEEGTVALEIAGRRKQLEGAIGHLTRLGVGTQNLSSSVWRAGDRCIHCTACTSLCPTQALSVNRESMLVEFKRDTCIACELCAIVCPYNAMEVRF